MKYSVKFKVTGEHKAIVDAENAKEAEKKATNAAFLKFLFNEDLSNTKVNFKKIEVLYENEGEK